MKALIAMLAVAGLGTGSALAAEMTGYISDEKCAASGAKAKAASEWIVPSAFESCVQKCVKAGSPAVFVTEDNHILKIDAASMKRVTPHLGHKVTLSGRVEGDTLKVETIASVKL